MEPFIGQICLFGFDYAPQGWAQCNGQLLSVSQYTALFSLLGTRFGGNGQSTFGLPNLQGRVALGQGSNYPMGDAGGAETVSLNASQMPTHSHTLMVSGSAATTNTPGGNVLASSNGATSGEEPVTVNAYAPAGGLAPADPNAISSAGSGQPFNVVQPYLALNYCIALQGVWPSRP